MDSNIKETKEKKLANLISQIIEIINPDAEKEIKDKTPMRYSKALLELTQGYVENITELLSDAIFSSEGYNDMIVVRDISFNSMCEHHMLPFFGECTIGYIPKEKFLGLSKFPRMVQCLSRKMHIQERLTKEIAETIEKILQPEGVIVLVSSRHSCMSFRGIKSVNASTDTVFTLGSMNDSKNQKKFFAIVNNFKIK